MSRAVAVLTAAICLISMLTACMLLAEISSMLAVYAGFMSGILTELIYNHLRNEL